MTDGHSAVYLEAVLRAEVRETGQLVRAEAVADLRKTLKKERARTLFGGGLTNDPGGAQAELVYSPLMPSS